MKFRPGRGREGFSWRRVEWERGEAVVDFASVRSEMKTGDLVLFSGKGAVSGLIRWVSRGRWSHVGMVVRLGESDEGLMLWESTTLTDVPAGSAGPARKGVQLVPLGWRLSGYEGRAAWRALSVPVDAGALRALSVLRRKLDRRAYESDELELLRSAVDAVGTANREDLSTVFCSELVAEAYQAMGLLAEVPWGLPSNEYTPVDFSSSRDGRLALLGGRRLGPEVELTVGGGGGGEGVVGGND